MIDTDAILPLIYNAALLTTLVLVYDLLAIPVHERATLRQQILLGAVAAVIGAITLVTAWHYAPGIAIDTRSALLAITGLFFGAVPVLIAMLTTALLRIYEGGEGVTMGVLVIIASGLIGLAWRRWRGPALASLTWRDLFLLGMAVSFTVLLAALALPQPIVEQVLAVAAVPILLVNTLATMLLGRLLVNRLQRAETAGTLRASEERYRSYVDNAPYGVFVTDIQGAYQEVNAAACQITGYTAPELLGMQISDLIAPEVQADAFAHFSRALGAGSAVGEFPFLRKDGSQGWFVVSAVRLSDTRMLGFVEDRTAAHADAEARRRAEADYRDLYEHAPDMFASVDAQTLRVIRCNETFAAVTGYTKEEVIGRPIRDFYHPDCIENYRRAVDMFLTTGAVHNVEMKVVRKDGSILWVILNTTAVRTPDGRITHSRSIWRDITDRKLAEDQAAAAQAALKHSEQRFRHVAASIADIAYSCVNSGAGYALEWITGAVEKITGYTGDEMIAMFCWGNLILEEDRPTFQRNIIGLEPGAQGSCELRLCHRDGAFVWIEASAECVAEPAGSRIYGAINNISQRKQIEEKLRKSEQQALALLNATTDAAFLLDRQGVVLATNAELCRRFGRSEDEMVGKPIGDLLPDDLDANRQTLLATVFQTRRPVRFRDQRGDRVLDNSVYPVLGVRGEVEQVAIFSRDMTETLLAEERYERLFQAMPSGLALHEIICDAQGNPVDYRFLAANPAFERLTGLQTAEIIGRTVLEVLPGTESTWIETYGRVALTGAPALFESYSHNIGRWYDVTAYSPAQGRFVTIFSDITEERSARLALQRHDALLAALSFMADRFLQAERWERTMPAVLARLGEAIGASRTYLLRIAASDDDFTAQRTFAWHAPDVAWPATTPEDRLRQLGAEGCQRWVELLRRGEMVWGRTCDLPENEQRMLEAQAVQALVVVPIIVDKQWWGAIGVDFCATAYELPEAELELMRAVGNTVAAAIEKQTSRDMLEYQAEQTAQVVHSAPDGMMLLDVDGEILLTNALAQSYLQSLTGTAACTRITVLGELTLADLLAPVAGERKHTVHHAGTTYSVTTRPVEHRPSRTAWVLVMRDITAELATQQQLQRQERLAAIGQLAAGIAHDFNNLMSVIILYAQITAQSPTIGERERERLAIIEHQGQRGTAMIRQILDFSRRGAVERQPVDLLPLVKEQVKLLARTLPEHITIRLDSDAGEYVVRGDPARIEQVLMNLAVNARDAMPEGGSLTLRLDHVLYASEGATPFPGMHDGDWIRLVVADTGSGITAEALDHVFEPFFTTKAPGIGTGLGLAQVHGIVAQHEGFITVESQPGKGARFTIYLPALAMVRPGAAPTAQVAALAQGRGQHILVVEDEPFLRDTLTELLQTWHYHVTAVANGVAALAAIDDPAHGAFDLIISDVVMPEMTGIALFKALQQRADAPPLILLTGHPLTDELDHLRRFGLWAWLPKPPSAEDLAATIAAALARNEPHSRQGAEDSL